MIDSGNESRKSKTRTLIFYDGPLFLTNDHLTLGIHHEGIHNLGLG